MAGVMASPDLDTANRLITLTRDLVADVSKSIHTVGFWDNPTKQDELRKFVKQQLDASDLFDFSSLDELAVELIDVARANQHQL